MTPVKLRPYEVRMAAAVGFSRQMAALADGRKPAFAEEWPGQLMYNHIAAACAECAVCRYLGIYWGGGVDTFKASDADGGRIEIRYSPTITSGSFKRSPRPKVRPSDTMPVIAVTSVSPSLSDMTIIGWIEAEDAKRPQWASRPDSDRPPCYFPPMDAWRDIDEFQRERVGTT